MCRFPEQVVGGFPSDSVLSVRSHPNEEPRRPVVHRTEDERPRPSWRRSWRLQHYCPLDVENRYLGSRFGCLDRILLGCESDDIADVEVLVFGENPVGVVDISADEISSQS